MSTYSDPRIGTQPTTNVLASTPPIARKSGTMNSRSFSQQNNNDLDPKEIKEYIQHIKNTNKDLINKIEEHKNLIQRLENEKTHLLAQKQEETANLRSRIETLEGEQTRLTISIQNLSQLAPLANSILSDKKVLSANDEAPVGQDPIDKRAALLKRIAAKVEDLHTVLAVSYSAEENKQHLQFYVGKFNKFKKELIEEQDILQTILGDNRVTPNDAEVAKLNDKTRVIFNRCMVKLGEMSDLLKDLLIKANPTDSRLPATGLVTPLFRTYTSARIFKIPGGDQPFQATKDTLQAPADWVYEESIAEDPKASESKKTDEPLNQEQPQSQEKNVNENAN